MFSFRKILSRLFNLTPVQTPALSENKQTLSVQQSTDKQRIAWIDQMILIVPEFVRTNQVKTQPIHFFFIYSAQTQMVLYRADSCVCGICFTNGYGILGQFSEMDWTRFQELLIERLDYFNDIKDSTHPELYSRVIVVLPMHRIRDICIAWMFEQDTVSMHQPFGKIPDGHCASC